MQFYLYIPSPQRPAGGLSDQWAAELTSGAVGGEAKWAQEYLDLPHTQAPDTAHAWYTRLI